MRPAPPRPDTPNTGLRNKKYPVLVEPDAPLASPRREKAVIGIAVGASLFGVALVELLLKAF